MPLNTLILSQISIPAINQTIPVWETLRGPEIDTVTVTNHLGRVAEEPQVIISMGIGVMNQTLEAIARWPNAKLFCYHWDCYEWIWTNPREGEYDYNQYGRLLAESLEIWVPSACTAQRTREWWDLPSKVIPSSCPYWYWAEPEDKGYILCTLREIPDQCWDWFQRACEELALPYKMSRHEMPYRDYQELVAGCKFMVSQLYEASTGGLSLLEGYHIGKPVLINASALNGAGEYFGSRAEYFDSYEDLKTKLLMMFHEPIPIATDHRTWVVDNFSSQLMVKRIKERICAHVSN